MGVTGPKAQAPKVGGPTGKWGDILKGKSAIRRESKPENQTRTRQGRRKGRVGVWHRRFRCQGLRRVGRWAERWECQERSEGRAAIRNADGKEDCLDGCVRGPDALRKESLSCWLAQ